MRTAKILGAVVLLLACQSPEERLAEHRKRAQAYFDNEQWSEAKIEYLNGLQLEPDDAGAHLRLGEVLWNLQEYGEARWQYREAVRLDPENVSARLRLTRIELVAQNSKLAREHVDAVLEMEPENVEALVLRGVLASQAGDLDALLADVDRALEVDPTDAAALLLKARGLEAQRDLEGAEAAYGRLLESHPTTQHYIALALFLASAERTDDALDAYKRAVEVADDEREKLGARVVLANAYVAGGNSEAAEAELAAARQEAPDSDEVLLTLARFYASQGEADRAVEMLELRAERDPTNLDAILALVAFHRGLGHRDEALAAVERSLAVDPESEQALLVKAELLMEVGSENPQLLEESREILAGVLEKNPISVRGLFTQGKLLLLEGHTDEAASKLRRGLDEEPNSGAHALLGTAYLRMNEPELARSELLRALQLNPSNVAARAQLASLYSRMGERELAIQEAKAALRQRPTSVPLLMLLAREFRALGEAEQAREVLAGIDVEKGVEERPRLRVQLAEQYRKLGDVERARELLAEEDAANPDDASIVAQQALLDLADRDPMASLTRLNEAIEKHPDSGLLYELRARVRLGFLRDGELVYAQEAEEDLKAAIEHGGDRTDPYMLLAGLYQQTSRTEDAIQTYEQARDAGTANANLRLMLGTLYEQLGRQQDAVREYEAVLRLDPDQGVALNNLAWLLAQTDPDDAGTLDRALAMAQQAKALLPENPSVADTLGWVMLKKNAPTAAISLFREAIDGYDPGDPIRALIRFHLAQAYQRGGEEQRAIQELQTALSEAPAFPERAQAEQMLQELQAS